MYPRFIILAAINNVFGKEQMILFFEEIQEIAKEKR